MKKKKTKRPSFDGYAERARDRKRERKIQEREQAAVSAADPTVKRLTPLDSAMTMGSGVTEEDLKQRWIDKSNVTEHTGDCRTLEDNEEKHSKKPRLISKIYRHEDMPRPTLEDIEEQREQEKAPAKSHGENKK
ncbi:MAG: hypothetical protein V1928_02945 [Parcubacteria group bacterium]